MPFQRYQRQCTRQFFRSSRLATRSSGIRRVKRGETIELCITACLLPVDRTQESELLVLSIPPKFSPFLIFSRMKVSSVTVVATCHIRKLLLATFHNRFVLYSGDKTWVSTYSPLPSCLQGLSHRSFFFLLQANRRNIPRYSNVWKESLITTVLDSVKATNRYPFCFITGLGRPTLS
jgi:hypothetical protein